MNVDLRRDVISPHMESRGIGFPHAKVPHWLDRLHRLTGV